MLVEINDKGNMKKSAILKPEDAKVSYYIRDFHRIGENEILIWGYDSKNKSYKLAKGVFEN